VKTKRAGDRNRLRCNYFI